MFFTSLVGAKGLSAEHVFIVGLNDRHLPSKAGDDEICGFLVGLSRTRKRCHLISYRFFYKSGLRRSPFLEWVSKHLEVVTVNKDYEFAEASEETSQGGDGTTGGESTKSRDGEV